MDETALFYELGPSQTLSCSKVIGTKISKKRVTIALCANSTGSTKITPFLINNVGSPRIFKLNNFNPSVFLDYESNKKSMDDSTFIQHIHREVKQQDCI